MSLAQALLSRFPPSTRERGQQLFLAGRVKILRSNRFSIDAKVLGSAWYEVELERQRDEILPYCDCPAFDTYGLCKHLWALILEADHRGLLQGEPGAPAPQFGEPFSASLTLSPPSFTHRDSGWHELFRTPISPPSSYTPEPFPPSREIHYTLDVSTAASNGQLILAIFQRDRKKTGDWAKPKPIRITRGAIPTVPSPSDREILSILAGVPALNTYVYYSSGQALPPTYSLRDGLGAIILPRVAATNRLWIHPDIGPENRNATLLRWDDGPPFQLVLTVSPFRDGFLLSGSFQRGDERFHVASPFAVIPEGLLITSAAVIARCEFSSHLHIVNVLRRRHGIFIPAAEAPDFVQEILSLSPSPPIELPEQLRFTPVEAPAQPHLLVSHSRTRRGDIVLAQVEFRYGAFSYTASDPNPGLFDLPSRQYLRRNPAAEQAWLAELEAAGVRRSSPALALPSAPWEFPAARLPAILQRLSQSGWQISIDGQPLRQSLGYEAELTGDIDWFELRGFVDYGGGVKASLPELLKALQRGSQLVKLDDGTFGFIPDDFLARYANLLELGQPSGHSLRYHRGQTGLLDVLLAQRPEIRTDDVFRNLRDELRQFSSIQPAHEPPTFNGELRHYQREGLAWMHFLQRLRLGGCLADDMGVGKTPQVLALLESRRLAGAPPSIAVVPRSLVYNWQQEAARFTPQLKVLDYSSPSRPRDTSALADYHLVLTTYGTLLRDIVFLKDFAFDYAILDEAQAVKNASSESAKAVRLLNAAHRLVLTGTPIENHLGDLWSLFEFLNPGMLGSSTVLKSARSSLRNPDSATRELLSRALRPYILRRTKQQVVRELPDKTEQTLYCELDTEQRQLYNELRDHYRNTLLHRIAADGMAKSRFFVLEALLRLRQAACHPGLIDQHRAEQSSAKLEALLPQLAEIIDEGHKALVFSQFTSLLAILQHHLNLAGFSYEYLDGQTRNRRQRINRFQSDPSCPLFLISLKAGGVGLNLTAADYVFLLDPWWNPAVEAQAVDRTHRIGQTKPVFAYRLIARDTVEEKVLLLQQSKRDLASAIIGEDKRLLAQLQPEDLELLLS